MMFSVCNTPFDFLLYFLIPERLSETCFAKLDYPITSAYVPNLQWGVVAFICTFTIELLLLWLLNRQFIPFKKIALTTFTVNVITHPIVFFFFPWLWRFFEGRYVTLLGTAELFAFATEAVLITLLLRNTYVKGSLHSIFINTSSWWIGAYTLTPLLIFLNALRINFLGR